MSKPLGHQLDARPLATWEIMGLRDALGDPWKLVYDIVWATQWPLREVLALRRVDIDRLPLDLADQARIMMLAQRRQRIFARGNRETPYTVQAAHAALKAAARKTGIRASVHPDLYRA